ncbi:MAG: exonuclease SbcCD subunit D [Thermoplasmata archaeon]|nr:MAG: exonuclease SbcCD subunit D [Thermoplasmata archaeon]
MRFLHIADTHLGFSAYRRINEDGVNQREIDIYNAFKQVIDYAIENPPDFILHAGDLFDSVRPNNRAISFTVDQLLRLSKKHIPFIVISGNHEHPRLRETGHIFSVLDHIEYIYPVYKNGYEKIKLDIKDKTVVIHAIPQTYSIEEFQDTIKNLDVENNADYNIILLHGSIKGIGIFTMGEFNELIIPRDIFSIGFDYIALGHYHIYTKLSERAFYSGSTETFSFSEAESKKGFIEGILEGKDFSFIFKPIETRTFIDLPSIDCRNLDIDSIMNILSKELGSISLEDAIVRITLENIPVHIYRNFDFQDVKEKTKKAFHFELKTSIVHDNIIEYRSQAKIDVLSNEFRRYISMQQIEEREELLKLGLEYISRIEGK